MRSTLTIDQSLDDRLRALAESQALSYKQVVNLALAKGLERLEVAEAGIPYVVETLRIGLKSGVDPNHLNALADDLDDQ